MDGILPLWKPKGFTSHDCVSKVRGMLKTRKVGHTGTLDPEVEGVLPLCIGRATKIVPFLTDTEKVYEAQVTLGFSTDTEDASGTRVSSLPVEDPPSEEKIKEVLLGFHGMITQVPPMYSAVKVNGKKLYEYAREGLEVERPERKITIKDIRLHEGSIIQRDETVSFSIRVVCSKGTYIRTLSADIGKALGYPSHMSSLVRTRTADIDKTDCYTMDDVQHYADIEEGFRLLLPISRGLSHLPAWHISEELKPLIQNGRVFERPAGITSDLFGVYLDDEVLAVYQKHPNKEGMIKPVRVF